MAIVLKLCMARWFMQRRPFLDSHDPEILSHREFLVSPGDPATLSCCTRDHNMPATDPHS